MIFNACISQILNNIRTDFTEICCEYINCMNLRFPYEQGTFGSSEWLSRAQGWPCAIQPWRVSRYDPHTRLDKMRKPIRNVSITRSPSGNRTITSEYKSRALPLRQPARCGCYSHVRDWVMRWMVGKMYNRTDTFSSVTFLRQTHVRIQTVIDSIFKQKDHW
jgi:hypothetical protein